MIMDLARMPMVLRKGSVEASAHGAVLLALSAVSCCMCYVLRRALSTGAVAAMAARAARSVTERDAARLRLAGEGLDWLGVLSWARQAGVTVPPEAVVQLSAVGLLDMIRLGHLSCVYVMRCFIARAMAAGGALGCNAGENFEAALAEAVEADRDRAAGRLRGPLHGLPVSIKDQFDMAGFDSTLGLACRVGSPAREDAVLVRALRAAGAIPFVRTAVPQLLMAPETFSFWGVALNPWDLNRTAGGSSGGEAALLAARGSPVGIGTDVAGSIRIPAAYCGVCGFKPTNGRLSMRGVAVARRERANGQKEIIPSAGPMGRCVADLELVMRALCNPAGRPTDTGEGGDPAVAGPAGVSVMHALDYSLPPVGWDCQAYLAATGLTPSEARGAAGHRPAARCTASPPESQPGLRCPSPECTAKPDVSVQQQALGQQGKGENQASEQLCKGESQAAGQQGKSESQATGQQGVCEEQASGQLCESRASGMPCESQASGQLGKGESQVSESQASGPHPRKLRVGVLIDDGWFEPAPACARAVREAAAALQAAGHPLVDFAPGEDLRLVVQAYIGLAAADGKFRSFVEALEGEELHTNYSFLFRTAQLPNWARPAAAAVLNACGERRKAALVLAATQKSAYEYWRVAVARDKLQEVFLDRWRSLRVDVLLCPANGLPALPHGQSVLLAQACSYNFVFNAFNLPAGTVNVTAVKADEQEYRPTRDPADSFCSAARRACAGSAGLPVGVQMVGLPWQDEVTLGAMRALEYALDSRAAAQGAKAARHGMPPYPPLPTAGD
jgi:Asp-tRNA(Asn)/Glu-tRNA(Gln) amidotransferase A subunit family amidase